MPKEIIALFIKTIFLDPSAMISLAYLSHLDKIHRHGVIKILEA